MTTSVQTLVHNFRLRPFEPAELRKLVVDNGVLYSHGLALARATRIAEHPFVTITDIPPQYLTSVLLFGHLSAVHAEFRSAARLPTLDATWEQTLQYYQAQLLNTSSPQAKLLLTNQLNAAQHYFSLSRPAPAPQDVNPVLNPEPFAYPATMRQTSPRLARTAVSSGRRTAVPDTAPSLFAALSAFLKAPETPIKFGTVYSRLAPGTNLPTLYYASAATPLARVFPDVPRRGPAADERLLLLAYHHNPRVMTVLRELRRLAPRHTAVPNLTNRSPELQRVAMNNIMLAIYQDLASRGHKTKESALLADDYHYLAQHSARINAPDIPMFTAPDPRILRRFTRRYTKNNT